MTNPIDIDALQQRFDRDERESPAGSGGATEERLAAALDDIGWRSAGGASSSEVAPLAGAIIASCVRDHRDPATAVQELATLLHDSMEPLDGGLPAVSEFMPAAAELLRRYTGEA
jgi:hypothetical protein